jgi:hypothetical protein
MSSTQLLRERVVLTTGHDPIDTKNGRVICLTCGTDSDDLESMLETDTCTE